MGSPIKLTYRGIVMTVNLGDQWYFSCECGQSGHQFPDCMQAIREAFMHTEGHSGAHSE